MHGKWGPYARGILETVLAGGTATGDRRKNYAEEYWPEEDHNCKYCNMDEEEDAEHMYCRCPAWSNARKP